MVGTGTNPRQELGTGDPSREWAHDEGEMTSNVYEKVVIMPPWSARIPAASKKAEAGLRGEGMRWRYSGGGEPIEPMEPSWTAGELALAKALWAWFHQWQHDTHEEAEYPRALIAFTEKVERLT